MKLLWRNFSLNSNNQIFTHSKLQKLFDTCRLQGKWKRMGESLPLCYVAIENGASIELTLIKSKFSESFIFKKDSQIIIKDSIAEFQEEDLLR